MILILTSVYITYSSALACGPTVPWPPECLLVRPEGSAEIKIVSIIHPLVIYKARFVLNNWHTLKRFQHRSRLIRWRRLFCVRSHKTDRFWKQHNPLWRNVRFKCCSASASHPSQHDLMSLLARSNSLPEGKQNILWSLRVLVSFVFYLLMLCMCLLMLACWRKTHALTVFLDSSQCI